MSRSFPQDFIWGTATASFQVEGAATEGGRTPSIWDTLCLREGAVIDKSDGSVACDQYHRYPEDIEIMKQLGVGAYRFSISWSRVIPDINGEVNPEGIAYYEGLIDALHTQELRLSLRSTTGICRSMWKTAADGRTARPHISSLNMWLLWHALSVRKLILGLP